MNVGVGVRSSPHRIDATSDGLSTHRWQLGVPDKVAVEAALRIADSVTAVGIGGDRARDSIRAALRMGADEGVHVTYDAVEEATAQNYARVLARAAGRERSDLLVIGSHSPVMEAEPVGVAAEQLGWPAVSAVTAIETDASADELTLRRKLEPGRQEQITLTPPAVLGIETAFGNPRRTPLDTVLAGQRAEIRTVELEQVAPGESAFSMSVGATTLESVAVGDRWGRGTPPESPDVTQRIRQMLGRNANEPTDSATIISGDSSDEAATEVVAYLREHDLL